ncbi:TIGR03364 family FAD-dependent oxidoreductase [Rhodobacteraceae bacterium KMM 6894]|nr:TIGR03364 family FAD-dependent oxidoreductase [Rhodobacteraceae bacterium KMM 6894]
MQQYDLAVVGGGIMGLAHALHGAQAGLSVAVFERGGQADGASVRNFGMLAIVAQRPGAELDSARRTLAHWQRFGAEAGINARQAGCLFVARTPQEMAVMQECAANADQHGQSFVPIARDDLAGYAEGLRTDTALGGLWSEDAWKLDQRSAMARLSVWLQRVHGVTFLMGCEVRGIAGGVLDTTEGAVRAAQTVICGGSEFARLFPADFAATGVTTCQLQMLRTAPQPGEYRLSPFVLGGLSLPRYTAFADCPSLPDLRATLAQSRGREIANGIHLIAAQEADGSITIGDSHHYGADAPRERLDEVDQLMMAETSALLALPDARIAQRWLGHYAHLPGQASLVLHPAPGVTAVTMTNGQGMTHGLAKAEDVIAQLFG